MPFVLGFAENSIQLVPDGTLILHVIIILVMIYVLNATLYRPINQILESREKRTRGRLTEAQEIMQAQGTNGSIVLISSAPCATPRFTHSCGVFPFKNP